MGLQSKNTGRGMKRTWWLARYQSILVPWLGCFILGITLAAYQKTPEGQLPNWTSLWIAGSWSLLLGGLLLLSLKRSVWKIVICLLGVLWGGVYYRGMHFEPSLQDVSRIAEGSHVRVVGEWLIHSDDPKKAFLNVQSVNAQPATGQLLVRTHGKDLPPSGSLVALDGRLSSPESSPIPGIFQEQRYLYSQGLSATLHHITRTEIIQDEPVSDWGRLNRQLSQMRSRIAATFRKAMPSPLSEILGGIVLGDQAIPVDKTVREEFTRTGLVHLLAASGMNLAIVAGFLFFIARLCRLPMRLQILFAMVGGLGYALLSGLSPSVLRATAMLEIALSLKLLNKKLGSIAVLMLAIWALILWNPELVTSIGFQLSVLTTFGILALLGPLQRWLAYYWGQTIAGTFLLPCIAQLWATPLLAVYFNELPLLSILLNIIVIPIVTVLTCLGFTAGLLSLLWEPAGTLTAQLSWPFVYGLNTLVHFTQSWEWAQWHIASPPIGLLIIFYAALIVFAYFLHFPQQYQQWQALIPQTFQKPKVAASLMLLFGSLVLYALKTNANMTQMSILPLNDRIAAFLIEDENKIPSLLLPANTTPWYSRRVADHLRHRNLRAIAHIYWFSTPEHPVHEDTQKAVIDTLQKQTRIRHIAMLTQPVTIGRWTLTPNIPLNPDALKQQNARLLFSSLWRLQSGKFCLEAALQKAEQIPTKWLNTQCVQYRERQDPETAKALPYQILLNQDAHVTADAHDFLQFRQQQSDWYLIKR